MFLVQEVISFICFGKGCTVCISLIVKKTNKCFFYKYQLPFLELGQKKGPRLTFDIWLVFVVWNQYKQKGLKQPFLKNKTNLEMITQHENISEIEIARPE